MVERLDALLREGLEELQGAADEEALQNWKMRYLGRSAELGSIIDGLRQLPKEERPLTGRRANEVKVALEKAHAERLQTVRAKELDRALRQEALDVTLAGRPQVRGRLHPANQTLRRIIGIWAEMGFQVYRSAEVEREEFNFEFLNMPPHHPARDMWDTFYATTPGVVLRTHTSPGQIHVMRERAPEPIRVVLPGMCYRYEQITARSEIQFNQVEGLAIGHRITFTDLKGTLARFARSMFGAQVRTRFRPAHFPFTEPSAEMDVECIVCGGEGCTVCKRTGWVEILGCGMVHPVVLAHGGYDAEVFSGFAFGMGSERITMLKYQIDDIRSFWENDLRFLEQF
jgi:phenylalanyl-tRNA synthetase alpha chain